MKARWTLRIISLVMFVVAVIFVFIALSCPTCGSVFYIGNFRVGADIWRTFYKFYAIVMVLLFVLSFIIPKKKTGR